MQSGAVQRHYNVTSIMSTPKVLPSLLEIIHVAGVVEKDARDAAAAAGVGLRLMTSGASRRRESDFRDDEARALQLQLQLLHAADAAVGLVCPCAAATTRLTHRY